MSFSEHCSDVDANFPNDSWVFGFSTAYIKPDASIAELAEDIDMFLDACDVFKHELNTLSEVA